MQQQNHLPITGHWINGSLSMQAEHGQQDILDPAKGQAVAHVPFGGVNVVTDAVRAAKIAQPAWAARSALSRARVMNQFLQKLDASKEDLARLISKEHGKVFPDALGEVVRGIEIVEYACGAPQLMKTGFSANIGGNIDNWVQRQPLGIAAGITPFNFPVMVPLWMAPIAMVTGNAFILKPSPLNASASLELANMLQKAGLPEGIFNVVQGGPESVNALIDHPDVNAISFVGSTSVARHVYERSAKNGKRVQALGGAKNHLVVMPDADPNIVTDALIGAAFGSAGERCMAISVAVFVGQSAQSVMPLLLEKSRSLRVQHGLQEGAEMGPIISHAARERIASYIACGIDEGATLLLDGREIDPASCGAECESGFWLGPTIFDNATPNMRIYQEEIFGPVLVCLHVDSLEDAIKLINQHSFANGVSLYTQHGGAARTFAQNIEVGMVGINVPIPVPAAWHGFGGWKQSLFGDMNIYGEEGIRFYTRQKSIMQRWNNSPSGASFAMPKSG